MKKCSKCGIEKIESDFSTNGNRGLHSACRACDAEYRRLYYAKNSERSREAARKWSRENREQHNETKRRWRKENPEAHRAAVLKHRYGLSIEKYKEMEEKQGGRCWICQKRKKLVVDHCHVTGKVRGLLCYPCNGYLGSVDESIPILRRAIWYLSKGCSSS